ncbi:hypothetical protein HNQ93_001924 [Hymenobacter luteus]|uniref:Lipocalin-like domain-containing protein n=2 Tax=Hymenobacter TaxID=89966 RepID=A0A7W9WBK2_9BACT|nr:MULTISPECIES: hypothetical protein [Hymenobacter]MBB4600715.1 hypothetical protein [Hymenobacter latericoloratus]MBB6059078.1 hypothetical protein [Hymenobacter luteus]
MSELLFDVNLQQLPDDFLTGNWRVADRVLNRTDPGTTLAQAERFQLEPGRLEIQAPGGPDAGRWLVQRDNILNRPYLEIDTEQQQTRALITRLRRSRDGSVSQLSLYFQSGMEMQLTRP